MSTAFPVAGRKIYIGPVIAAPAAGALFTAGDFLAPNAPEWTRIGKWQSMGVLGGEQATITTPYLNEDYDEVLMGTKNPGTMQNTFGVVDADPGQIALYAAAGDRRLYQFLIEFPDAPVGGTPSYRLFAAYVTQPNEQGGEANTAGLMQVNMVKYRNVVRIAATGDVPPVWNFPPFIYSANLEVGTVVSSDVSNVSDGSVAYAWQLSANGTSGWGEASGTANAATYTLDADDLGGYIRLAATATGAGGSTVAYSNVIGPVIPA